MVKLKHLHVIIAVITAYSILVHLDWSIHLSNHSDSERASFDVLPLHFDVQLVPPSTGGLVAHLILATGFSLLHRAVCLLTSDL